MATVKEYPKLPNCELRIQCKKLQSRAERREAKRRFLAIDLSLRAQDVVDYFRYACAHALGPHNMQTLRTTFFHGNLGRLSKRTRTVCPSGLRGWTQVPLAPAAWVQIPQLSFTGAPFFLFFQLKASISARSCWADQGVRPPCTHLQ